MSINSNYCVFKIAMRSVNLFARAKIYEINFVYIISEAVLKCEVFLTSHLRTEEAIKHIRTKGLF